MSKRIIAGIGEELLLREQLTPDVAAWEDGWRTDGGPGTFEWWYFDAHFDDGSTAVVTFATKPLLAREGGLNPLVTLTITRPDGTRLGSMRAVPAGDFEAARDACRVHAGSARVAGDLGRYELHCPGDGVAADLTFTRLAPSWRPGTGKSYYDPTLTHYFAWLVPIPFGPVEGTLTYNGVAHAVRGSGYHDHNWGNYGLEKALSHWVWGRAHVGDFTAIFVEMTASHEFGRVKAPVFMLARGDCLVADLGESFTLAATDYEKHPSGRSYPRTLDFLWTGEQGTVGIALRGPQLIDSFSLLAGVPGWKAWLGRRLLNPYYFRFNTGIELKVDLPGLRTTEHGTAIYELMLLH